MLSFKTHAGNKAGRLISKHFIFKKSFIWGKNKRSAAWFQYIWIALYLAYNKNKLYKILCYWSRDTLNSDFFGKGSGNSFHTIFCVWFYKKKVSHVIFYWLIKFHCPIPFTSWDIGQYVYCNCLFPRFWHH